MIFAFHSATNAYSNRLRIIEHSHKDSDKSVIMQLTRENDNNRLIDATRDSFICEFGSRPFLEW